MASRPELVQMCVELGIEWVGKWIDEMKSSVREEADRRFMKRRLMSADNLSDSLKKFLTEEYDYVIKDREGDIVG